MNGSKNGGTAVVPGSYDPVTFGHLDIIARVANVFDRVIVGVVNQAVRKGKTVFCLRTGWSTTATMTLSHAFAARLMMSRWPKVTGS